MVINIEFVEFALSEAGKSVTRIVSFIAELVRPLSGRTLRLLEPRGERIGATGEKGEIGSHGGKEASRVNVAPRERFVACQDAGRVPSPRMTPIAFSIVATMSGCFC